MIVAGNSSLMDSGTESVFLLPMNPHRPGGGVGEVWACPGVFVGFVGETGPPLPGEVITRITATAAMIPPAVPMASHADRASSPKGDSL